MKIIPAIDIIDGKCVRLSQGDYLQKKVYHENPVEVAKTFENAGFTHLHVVDLDGAKNRKISNWKSIKEICAATQLHIDFGGGITTKSDINQLLVCGVKQVNLGSIAVKKPEKVSIWLSEFGADKIILSADVRNNEVALHGWSENSSITINEFLLNYQRIGIQYVTCTDISTDGMLTGPNLTLYKNLRAEFPSLKLITSGGISCVDDIYKLKSIGVEGVIVGKALYEGKISLAELQLLNS